ncbi:MAG: thioredoxin [Solirubrobacterales bacterium]|nr:thioredoxin [Solirubrobacterales bacterium]
MIADVAEADFETRVLERSREVPVVVDFWAEWCGPCRTLGPAIESAVRAREGAVELAKVDVDSNQRLAASFGIQGIPAVKAFRDGKVVAEFVGAQPLAQIEGFLDELVPSEAEQLVASGDEDSLRRALELDPHQSAAAVALAKLLLARGDAEEALEVLAPHRAGFVADGLAARAELELGEANRATDSGNDAAHAGSDAASSLHSAFGAWDDGRPEDALEKLQLAVAETGDEHARDLIRRAMVGIFTELGPGHPLAAEHRRRLASALN